MLYLNCSHSDILTAALAMFSWSSAACPFESLKNCHHSDFSQAFVQRDTEGRTFSQQLIYLHLFLRSVFYKNIRFTNKYLFYGQNKFSLPQSFIFLSVLIKIAQTERQLWSRQTVWVNVRQELHATRTHMHTSILCVCWYFLLMTQQLLRWDVCGYCSQPPTNPEPAKSNKWANRVMLHPLTPRLWQQNSCQLVHFP